jgi:hypothetical protein
MTPYDREAEADRPLLNFLSANRNQAANSRKPVLTKLPDDYRNGLQ